MHSFLEELINDKEKKNITLSMVQITFYRFSIKKCTLSTDSSKKLHVTNSKFTFPLAGKTHEHNINSGHWSKLII